MSGGYIVRVFDGRRSVHAGTFYELERASARSRSIASRARRRGMNVSVTVRPLVKGGASIDEILDGLAERALYHASSYAGQNERGGDAGDRAEPVASRRAPGERDVADAMLKHPVGLASLREDSEGQQ